MKEIWGGRSVRLIKGMLVIVLLVGGLSVSAQKVDSISKGKLVFQLPLLDVPYHFDAMRTVNDGQLSMGSFFGAYVNPSMKQSLNVSVNLVTGLHYGIDKLFRVNGRKDQKELSSSKKWLYMSTLVVSDVVSVYTPGFSGWLHEEFHRSPMTRFGVNSFNDMNTFPLGASTVSVNTIKDRDLERFKAASSSDFIRMHVAGIEGEYLLVDHLQRNNFFYDQELFHEFSNVLSVMNSIAYVQACSKSEEVDNDTEEMSLQEPLMSQRDFTGFDFIAWTYDLFRPDEPYASRGTHPLGNGIDRYRKTTDLLPHELQYLKRQGQLQWLNVISPMIFGVRKISLGTKGLYGNFAVRNYLTSFGNDISLNLLFKKADWKFLVGLHSAQNYTNSFPALEVSLIDYAQAIGNYKLLFTPRVLMGTQPEKQRFKGSSSAFLGLLECKVELNNQKWYRPYIEVSTKTKGWVAGNDYLDDNFSCRLGVVARFNR